MNSVWLIARNTIMELLRNRILYLILFFIVFLILLTAALGQLSYKEQFRLSLGLGLPSIHLSIVFLTIFIGGSMVYREIEKLTIVTLLARPVKRYQFLLGKYFGFYTVSFLITALLVTIFSLNLSLMGFELSYVGLLQVFLGFIFEVALILSVTVFFSTFCSSFLTSAFSISFFIIGHWIYNLDQYLRQTEVSAFLFIGNLIDYTLPSLELFNLRIAATGDLYSWWYVMSLGTFALLWVGALLGAATLVFQRRDFA